MRNELSTFLVIHITHQPTFSQVKSSFPEISLKKSQELLQKKFLQAMSLPKIRETNHQYIL